MEACRYSLPSLRYLNYPVKGSDNGFRTHLVVMEHTSSTRPWLGHTTFPRPICLGRCLPCPTSSVPVATGTILQHGRDVRFFVVTAQSSAPLSYSQVFFQTQCNCPPITKHSAHPTSTNSVGESAAHMHNTLVSHAIEGTTPQGNPWLTIPASSQPWPISTATRHCMSWTDQKQQSAASNH